jgi:prepilin-type N-terminal cleavage/methylation domain-containing protein
MDTQEHQHQHKHKHQEREQGFTLIELLIAIVVVGVLTAVAVVGIGGLIDNGSTSACQASADAARAATAVHFSNTPGGAYPASFADMITPKELEVPTGVVNATPTTLVGKNWTLTMINPGVKTVNYECSTTAPVTT